MQPQKASQKLHFDHYTQVGCCIYLFRLLTIILAQKQTATVCSGSTLFANIQHTTKADSFCCNWQEDQIIDVHAR